MRLVEQAANQTVESRFMVETNDGLIDVSECDIKIKSHGPVMEYDPPDIFHNLVAKDTRTEKEKSIAKFNHKKWAESAYERIEGALKKNESYVDIRDCESDDQKSE